jgi:hypothetical protein
MLKKAEISAEIAILKKLYTPVPIPYSCAPLLRVTKF